MIVIARTTTARWNNLHFIDVVYARKESLSFAFIFTQEATINAIIIITLNVSCYPGTYIKISHSNVSLWVWVWVCIIYPMMSVIQPLFNEMTDGYCQHNSSCYRGVHNQLRFRFFLNPNKKWALDLMAHHIEIMVLYAFFYLSLSLSHTKWKTRNMLNEIMLRLNRTLWV